MNLFFARDNKAVVSCVSYLDSERGEGCAFD